MHGSKSPTLAHMAPVFQASDLAAAIAYYRDRLLFDVRFEWADADGEPVRYAVLGREDAGLHLTKSEAPLASAAYCFVSGVDDYYALVKDAGANITVPIADQPWQMREFETVDDDGNVLLFGEHLERVSE
jgi:uncharacterized glyoxalase superfamily protein PhnB